MIVQLLLGSILTYITWSFACLEANVRKARDFGVPVIRLPIDANNVVWILLQPYLWMVLDRLPFDWSTYPRFVRLSRRGWFVAEGAEPHVQLGPVWALVSPMAVNLHFSDPDTIQDIVTRRGDFQRPFRELTRSMLHSWTRSSSAGIDSYQKDTRMLSLNVLAAVGFRKSYDFRGSAEPSNDEIGSYRDSLQTVLDNIILLMLIPARYLRLVPGTWARIGNTAITFKQHMEKMLGEETRAINQGTSGSGGIITSFVRAADVHNVESAVASDKAGRKKGLSVDEVFGNLFVINFAGHDTTANTLAFAMLLLAAHPDVQEWLSEEIKAVTEGTSDEMDYKQLFPQLKRCRAVMYEVLRLYPPVPALPSISSNGTHMLKCNDRTLVIPQGVTLTVNIRAMQMHPQYWHDASAWKPARWITNPAPVGSTSINQISEERILEPNKKIFLPWGEGPQICPGKKFAQVEEVAVLACLFRGHRVFPMQKSGESSAELNKRVLRCLNDVDLEMLVRLRDADQVTLVCKEA
ncbi:hypothetical protein KVR01_007460 [Diaporthe batatas]|uniref:uncharacterized protein n=1 Tax=Diaporthe batatas TaxID=748121 RepID=UPI001D0395E8|nr:uncharacterized protein KVR01_007460 [Diaporthe batatas]KAG8162982.1 hypothetical protein KVR01_007460 [Diaporthe batatas]